MRACRISCVKFVDARTGRGMLRDVSPSRGRTLLVCAHMRHRKKRKKPACPFTVLVRSTCSYEASRSVWQGWPDEACLTLMPVYEYFVCACKLQV